MNIFLIGIITEDLIPTIMVKHHLKRGIQTNHWYYNFA